MGQNNFLSFTAARKYVQTLKLKNTNAWKQYSKSSKKPSNIPANPSQAYAEKGWTSIPDWLGNGNISNKKRTYVTYEKCQNFAQKLNITKQKEWENYFKSNHKPKTIPSHPDRIYSEWKGWGDFFGTKRIANQNISFWSYEKSMKYVHLQKFKNQTEFRMAAKTNKLPSKIPKSPMTVFKNKGWTNWGDWLGSKTIANQTLSKNYLPKEKAVLEARTLAKKYNLKSHDDWIKAHQEGKIPKHLPRHPWQVYLKKKKK